MNFPTGIVRGFAFAATAILMLAAGASARAQSHESTSDGYTLRGSTVSTESIPEKEAKAHGIEQSPRRGILNVTVLKKGASGAERTMRADVHAYAKDLNGYRREIAMKPTVANGYVSYAGTYDFVHGEVIDFTVTAKPEDSGRTLTLTFRDRMWANGDLPDVPHRRE